MAKLTQEQQDTLHYVIRPFLECMSAIGSDTYASKILDIIETLQRDEPPVVAAATFKVGDRVVTKAKGYVETVTNVSVYEGAEHTFVYLTTVDDDGDEHRRYGNGPNAVSHYDGATAR